MSLIMGNGGELSIYPEIASTGYFDIDYGGGQLVLKATRWVGLIPISDRVAIHVEPKAPIGNLFYMVWRAGFQLKGLESFVRTYQEELGAVQRPEEIYVRTFLNALREMQRDGLLKKYTRIVSDRDMKGRILLGPSVSRFYARGYRHRHVFESYEHTVDNHVNQIIKHTLERMTLHFARRMSKEDKAISRELRLMLQLFSPVSSLGVHRLSVARDTLRLIRELAGKNRYYQPALWLAYLVATKSGVLMHSVGKAQFESLLINVSDVFEGYVRKLCEEAAIASGLFRTRNGNSHGIPLFRGRRDFETQPDYYFEDRSGNPLAVADAKYKPKPKTEDRYELLAFCEALGVQRGAFILPSYGYPATTVHQGTTRGGIEVHLLTFDLTTQDWPAEEQRFMRTLMSVLRLPV